MVAGPGVTLAWSHASAAAPRVAYPYPYPNPQPPTPTPNPNPYPNPNPNAPLPQRLVEPPRAKAVGRIEHEYAVRRLRLSGARCDLWGHE
jgi:hypothetical protein